MNLEAVGFDGFGCPMYEWQTKALTRTDPTIKGDQLESDTKEHSTA